MNIITKPEVSVVGVMKFRPHPKRKLPPVPEATPGKDYIELGAFGAKGCYDSFGEDGRACEANQREVIQHRHGSVLEHLVVSVWVEGFTRACSLEVNRHRPLAISQRSTRYTTEENASIVLDPYFASLYERYGTPGSDTRRAFMEDIGRTGTVRVGGDGWLWAHNEMNALDEHVSSQCRSIMDYEHQVEQLVRLNPESLSGVALRKWARGKARNVLPHGLETRALYTGNLRAWRWVIENRTDGQAEDEVRRLALALFHLLRAEVPLYFEDMQEGDVVRGIPQVVTPYRKV